MKFSFERAKADDSKNKAKKAVFDNISRVTVVDPQTVILTLDHADPTMPFRLGENTAVILHPDTAAQAATNPVGTGPYMLTEWKKGSSITLTARADAREKPAIQRVTFRFINDPAAQVAALLAGDIDGMPRFGALQSLRQFQGDHRFTVQIGSTAGKGQLTINNKKKPFDDVRVRRAIMHAIDRKAFIDGVLEGLGEPIGSHFAPTDAGYVDLTGVYPYDPEKAKALLKEAGVATPLNVTLTLPPPPYARKGGEVVAAMLAKVGINAKIENVEWAQWLSGPFKGNFDLTIINHVEPLDYVQYTNKDYYWGYDSKTFDDLFAAHAGTTNAGRAPAPVAADAAPADHRRRQRLDLQPVAGDGGEEGPAGPVDQLADLRQRHRRRALGPVSLDLHALPAAAAAGAVPRGATVSPVEVAHAVLDHIARWEPHVHALYAFEPERVLAQARASEARWRAGTAAGAGRRAADDQGEHRHRRHAGADGQRRPPSWCRPRTTHRRPRACARPAPCCWPRPRCPTGACLSSGLSSFHPLTRNPWQPGQQPRRQQRRGRRGSGGRLRAAAPGHRHRRLGPAAGRPGAACSRSSPARAGSRSTRRMPAAWPGR